MATLSKQLQYQKQIKYLIWAYMLLILLEGAIRKWVLPSMSDALLIARDPVVFAIYAMAFMSGNFPKNRIIGASFILAIVSVLFGLLANGNPIVTAYGVRINYFHVPLIYVMFRYLNLKDVHLMGKFFLLFSIVMTIIMVLQFYSPSGAWINKAPGGIEGEGIMGAKGRNRPPGTFSFITGIASFYPIVTAFLLTGLLRIKFFKTWLMYLIAGSLVTAMFVSISRLTFLSCLIVCLTALASLVFMKVKSNRIFAIIAGVGLLLLILPSFDFFNDGVATFGERWNSATDMQEGKEASSLLARYLTNFTSITRALENASFFGSGIGSGSNVGSKFLTGAIGFSMGESEWEKIVFELGPILGLSYIAYRIILFFSVAIIAFKALRITKNPLPVLLFSATGLLLLNGQWSPPTIQGFATFGAGMTLASCKIPKKRQNKKTPSTRKGPQLVDAKDNHPKPPPPPKTRKNISLPNIKKRQIPE